MQQFKVGFSHVKLIQKLYFWMSAVGLYTYFTSVVVVYDFI